MKNLTIFVLIMIVTSSYTMLMSQPSFIYEGGDGGGYGSNEYLIPTLYQFQGGNGVGYCSKDYFIIDQYLFEGGLGDGFVSKKINVIDPPFYLGGNNGGFIMADMNDSQTVKLFQGGINDGYVLIEKCEDFIWTGAIGTGWLESGNWNYNIIPDLKRSVVIPNGVPNFPHLNAGVFAIGDNPNNGAFECGQLWIQEGSLLETRLNNKVENYGNIKIDGTMNVKNSIFDALQNLENGLIKISPTGALIVKP